LKSAAKGSDAKDLQRKMDDFNESLQKIGQHIYQQQGAASGAPSDGSPSGQENEKENEEKAKKEGDVVDADYREVN